MAVVLRRGGPDVAQPSGAQPDVGMDEDGLQPHDDDEGVHHLLREPEHIERPRTATRVATSATRCSREPASQSIVRTP